jgi:hypothetical protein
MSATDKRTHEAMRPYQKFGSFDIKFYLCLLVVHSWLICPFPPRQTGAVFSISRNVVCQPVIDHRWTNFPVADHHGHGEIFVGHKSWNPLLIASYHTKKVNLIYY